jgi:drug/metabolite transporter (DMT)-like permease
VAVQDRRTSSPIGAFIAVLLVAQLAVGSAALMARAALDGGMEPLPLAAWRMTVASGLLLVTSRLLTGKSAVPLDRPMVRRLLLAGLFLGLHFAAWFASLQTISVARSTLLVATGPVWTGLASHFLLRQRMPLTFWLGLTIAAAGVWMVTVGHVHPDSARWSGVITTGDLLAVAGAIFIAAYLLLVQNVQSTLGTWRTVTWTYSAAALTLWPVVFAFHPPADVLPDRAAAWGAVLALALVPQLMGHTAMNWCLKRLTAGAVATATLLEPVFAGALAWLLLNERLTPTQMVGGGILLCGVALALWRSGRPSVAQVDGIE